jgi:mycofactocin precursor peptide peptidase
MMELLAIPVGATEQHGPHLPLTTDTDIAVALVAGLARAVAAPPLCFGSSGEHAGFAGTLSIGQEATEHVLVELGRSACESSARVLFVSTHGGNAAPVGRAVQTLRREGRDVRAWSPRFGGDAHAGRTETSLMLALHPDRVRMDHAEPGCTEEIASLMPRLQRDGVRAVSPNGVLGDPTGATPAEGHELLRRASEDLRAFVEVWIGAATPEASARVSGASPAEASARVSDVSSPGASARASGASPIPAPPEASAGLSGAAPIPAPPQASARGSGASPFPAPPGASARVSGASRTPAPPEASARVSDASSPAASARAHRISARPQGRA